MATAATLGGRGRARRPALGGAGLGNRAARAVDPGSGPHDVRHEAGRGHRPGRLLRAAMAPVESPGVPRQPAGPVHRLRLPDGRVLPDRSPAARARLGSREAMDVAADRGRFPRPGAAGRGSGHRNTSHAAAGGSRVRAVADVHDPDWLLPWRPAAGAAGALGGPAFDPHRSGPPGGRSFGPRGRLHGRHQRGLHPRRPGAARIVHTDPAGAPPLVAGRLVGGGGAAGHGLVDGTAAVPGPLRVQLPALHRAGEHHDPEPCPRRRCCAAAATGSRT